MSTLAYQLRQFHGMLWIKAAMKNDYPKLSKRLSVIYNAPVRICGPYINKDRRARVTLCVDKPNYFGKGKRHKVHQLAKVKLEAKLGRRLEKNETVDHIDNDITNDAYSNLQVLSRAENAGKQTKQSRLNNLLAIRKRLADPLIKKMYSDLNKGEKNNQAKVTNSQVKKIRIEYRKGKTTIEEIRKRYGFLTIKSVKDLLTGSTYVEAGGPIVPISLISRPSSGRPASYSLEQETAVVSLWKAGFNKRSISERVSVSYDTVRRILSKS